MREQKWLRCVVVAAWLGTAVGCDDSAIEPEAGGEVDAGDEADAGTGAEDAGGPGPDAGPVVPRPHVVFRLTNVGACAAKLITTVKTPASHSIRVEQGELRGTGFPNCICPSSSACQGNDYRLTFDIQPGKTVEFTWGGHRYSPTGGVCDIQPFPFGPVTVTVPYFALADASRAYKGPEVNVSQTFDYAPDTGVVEILLNPPKDLLVDGSPGVCP
ncbi:hypothetical protein SAMN05443572_1194 [Myxococcus fulvus]|uniref:Lipoprotein n=1 Tax=Myxococcus fulvus TaxID=33 RepID=A0A511TGE7_MYXFU|nr:hypothetical protein [Myxococcus fulvus]GEN13249.1 hypothetical protein MFU01_82860 [Myxococcus fulvus]SEU42208.1 hypothetical protein SAMN05443572_1194 [Myxococcus fulvus]